MALSRRSSRRASDASHLGRYRGADVTRSAALCAALTYGALPQAATAHARGIPVLSAEPGPPIVRARGGTTGSVSVDTTAGHALNSFSPVRAFGSGVDAQNAGAVPLIYTPANVQTMLTAGLGTVTYRLYTELSVQDWHWNPAGTWSDPSGQGYWTGAPAQQSQDVVNSYGYRLPERGFTHDQGNDDDYSRLTDGDLMTYWKSNPYLDSVYTGESDALHPQWVVIDLGGKKDVDAIRLAWANPYATAYAVQYWTGDDAINAPANGNWTTFADGTVSAGTGGIVTLQLDSAPRKVEFVRVLMSASSGTCDTHGSADARNCLGFAIDEIGVGTLSGSAFRDLVVHAANHKQTVTYASSVDPWHAPANQVTDEEQAGLDIVYTSGVTRGLPAIVPVSMLYGTPGDAAAEIAYLEARGYAIGHVEMGEEPDGQYVLPEDYGALYLQWAAALHAVDPTLQLGGPVFQGSNGDVQTWPDAYGNVSWLNRFLNYLNAHGALGELAFMSFEHYPFGGCSSNYERNLLAEPALVSGIVKTWKQDGLPTGTPLLVTESNYAANTTAEFQGIAGALWYADAAASFMENGAAGFYLYEYEPDPLYNYAHCPNGWGSWGPWDATQNYTIAAPASQYFAAQLLTQQWSDPTDAAHTVYPSTSSILDARKRPIVAAHAVLRPDGQWAVMLVNKDPATAYTISLAFNGPSGTRHFASPVTSELLSPAQYVWHSNGPNGYPSPDGPLAATSLAGGASATYTLPAASITVLRGTLGP